MLADFESRFSDVLGSRLPAPFAGRVRRRGAGAPGGPGPVVRVGVDAIEPLEADFGSVRPEIVPGAADLRRVLRLDVTVGIDILPQADGDRLQELAGIDAVVYELEHPEMRSAVLLRGPGDQGFLLDWLRLGTSDLSVDTDLVVRAQGWFWPIGLVGESGRAIERTLVREFRLPMQLDVGAPIEAGGAGVVLDVTFGATGTMVVAAGAASTAPFGALALRLLDPGGGPGAGALSGGQSGPGDTRLVDVDGGIASVTYQPPGSAAVDQLVVSAFTRDDDGNDRVGIELARFELVVR